MNGKTMCFAIVEETLLGVHAAPAAAEDEWAEWIEESVKPNYRGILVLIDPAHPGPSARQREATRNGFARRKTYPRVAVLVFSAAVRGVVTMLNWLQRGSVRAFHPSRIDDALDYVDVPTASRGIILDRAAEMAHHLGTSAVVELIAARSRPTGSPERPAELR